MKKLLNAMAVIGLVATPMAANAGTRPADVVPAVKEITRATPTVNKKRALGFLGFNWTTAAVVGGAVVAGAVIIANNNDDNSLSRA